VAFEIIEHVGEQERVMSEITRVLRDDGLLIMSTPDRRPYSEATGQNNPFHVRELSLEEFSGLVAESFDHYSLWGQRTVTGSQISPIKSPADPAAVRTSVDFFVERAGAEWRLAPGIVPLYLLAVASPMPLELAVDRSTLADPGLELLNAEDTRIAEVAARDLGVYVEDLRARLETLRERLLATETTRDGLTQELERMRRLELSVTVQLFTRLRGKLYGAIGADSLQARALQASLRFAGRRLIKSGPGAGPAALPAGTSERGPWITLPQFEAPLVSIVIPLRARADLTLACLESVHEHSDPVPYEVILVADDPDQETNRLLAHVTGAHIVTNTTNIGYLRSVNKGAAMARGDWLVLCNNDIEVSPDWLEALLRCANSAPDVGVVVPRYVFPDGRLNEAGGIVWREGTARNYGRGDDPDQPHYTYRREIDYGSAAAMLVRRELWDARQGFDERFLPMYYEDVDLCFDARERGFRVLYEPEAVVVHHEGATAGSDVSSGPKQAQTENRFTFAAKWRARLESDQLRDAEHNVRRAADRERGPRALVVDFRVPMPDHDAGSLRMLQILKGLRRRGCRVSLLPDNLMAVQPYTRDLGRTGVEVLSAPLDIGAELAAIGPELGLVILSRPHQAARWLDTVREVAPYARVVYDTVDLHWLREGRRAALQGSQSNGELGPKALALRELELAMVRATDVTFVVSETEREHVQADAPGADVRILPTVHDAWPEVRPPAQRCGVLFVGGFEHPPNVDAALRLVREVMPMVWNHCGDVPVTIVGSNAPPEVRRLASGRVDIAGWVPDLDPLLATARVNVAPLSYGAGLKGKITQSLAAGLPVVTTPIGAEGLDAADGEQLMIGDDGPALSHRVIQALEDDELWARLSRAGQELIAEQYSPAVVDQRLTELLDEQSHSPARA
jgi:GT2 family glycosyltransferase/glycosyltransferase involved in cell wall biosynthesis/SAM-dependent methyltransferase